MVEDARMLRHSTKANQESCGLLSQDVGASRRMKLTTGVCPLIFDPKMLEDIMKNKCQKISAHNEEEQTGGTQLRIRG